MAEAEITRKRSDTDRAKSIGFVSLGCPKATVDSEQIITQLRAEGYDIVPDFDGADMIIINTCGFIDAAVEESLDTISEALHENGRVIVTGCLGARADMINDRFPELLAVTGPHARDEVMQAVHQHLPAPHDPFLDLVPKQGVRLTPRHYACTPDPATLRLPEDFRGLQSPLQFLYYPVTAG